MTHVHKGVYHRDGLPARMLLHFANNPGSELTRKQAAALFNTTQANVSMAFKKLEDEGRLESVNVIRLPKGRENASVDTQRRHRRGDDGANTMTTLSIVKKPPSDLSTLLRRMADQVDANELTGMVIAYVLDDSYEFTYAASLNDCLVMSTLLQQNCIDRLRA